MVNADGSNIYNIDEADLRKNPLMGFRSTSYHFAIVVSAGSAGGSEVMSSISNFGGLDAFYRSPDDKLVVKNTGAGGQYLILYNSTTDADYFIKSLKYTNTLIMNAPSVAGAAGINSVGTSLTMQIVEPYTIDFVQQILDSAQVLGVTIAELVYGIKVWFTGYRDSEIYDGALQNIADIKPITFQIKSINLNITQAGTVYNLELATMSHVSDLSFIANTGGGTYQSGRTLRSAIDGFNGMLSRLSIENPIKPQKQNYIKYTVLMDSAYNDPRYIIDNVDLNSLTHFLGDDSGEVSAALKAEAVEGHSRSFVGKLQSYEFGSNENGHGTVHISTEKSDTVNTIIDKIFAMCSAVTDDINGVVVGDTRRSYKQIVQADIATDANDGMHIIFHISRQQISSVAASPAPTPEVPATVGSKPVLPKYIQDAIDNNALIEYDYIYTGHNTEVTQFVMSLPIHPIAIGPYKTITPVINVNPNEQQDQIRDAQSAGNNVANSSMIRVHNDNPIFGVVAQTKVRPEGDDGSPVIPPPNIIRTPDVGGHTVDPSAYLAYRKRLTNFISHNNPNATIEVRGNPFLLNSLVMPAGLLSNNKGEPLHADEVQKKMEDHVKLHPTFGGFMKFVPVVKLNIRIPKATKFQGSITDPEFENAFSTKFWCNTLFTPTVIEHSFENGIFLQRITMLGTTTDDSLPVAIHAETPNAPISEAPGNGFLDTASIGRNKKKKTPGAPKSGAPVGKNNKRLLKPTPEQQKLIDAAAAKYGVDPKLIEAVMRQESGFINDAKSGAGAQGLMQILPGTGKDLGITNLNDPAQSIDGGTRYLAQKIRTYDGDLGKALASYNYGEGAVNVWEKPVGYSKVIQGKTYYGGGGDYTKLPNETQNYVTRITGDYGSNTHPIPPKPPKRK
jgi:hypothetical protein